MKEIQAVIFDMDGVIVHSNPGHKKVIDEFLKKHGKEISEQELREHVYGRTNAEWIPYVFGDISTEEVQKLADEKEAWFRKIFNPKKNEVPGFTIFLKSLDDKGLKRVVATSAPAENEEYILSELEIKDRFDAILNSSHVTQGKPHPEPYLKAAKAAHVDPANCLVFEDSLAGVQSALAAGTTVLGVATTHTHEELSDCAMVIDDFEGLTFSDLEDLN